MTNMLQPTADDLAYFERLRINDLATRTRVTVERAIVRRAAQDLLAAGFQLRVWNGEGYECARTPDLAVVMSAIMASDQEELCVLEAPVPAHLSTPGTVHDTWAYVGSVCMVYGNDGYDVISDNSASVEEYLEGATELANELEAATNGPVETPGSPRG